MATNPEIDPEAFLRALLAVSADDAAEVREVADVKAKPDAAKEHDSEPE